MKAALLETAAASHLWEALITDEGEPFAAFVRGHVNPFTLAGDAEEAIIKAFNDLSPDFAGDVSEILENAGGAVISQFWLRPHGEPSDELAYFELATADQRRAFPVTGVRFQ
ncbi:MULTISPECIES: cell division protein FtsQ/DivIB [unclassified Ensifer]|uniref:cell division protein FtsQ/DivIB n=1 Tax=unclassified Ensifer TaxID=2633371 RepID=UPI00300FD569